MGLRKRKCCHRAKIEDDEQVEVTAVALVFSYIEVLGSASCHSKIRRYVAVISRDIRKYCGCFVGPSHTVHGWSPCSNRKKKSESTPLCVLVETGIDHSGVRACSQDGIWAKPRTQRDTL